MYTMLLILTLYTYAQILVYLSLSANTLSLDFVPPQRSDNHTPRAMLSYWQTGVPGDGWQGRTMEVQGAHLAGTPSHGSPYPSSRCPRRLLLDSWFRRSHLQLSQNQTLTQLSEVAMRRTENHGRQTPDYQGPLHCCLGENGSENICNKAGASTSEGQENARMSGTSSGKYYDLSSILNCTCNMYTFTYGILWNKWNYKYIENNTAYSV